MAKIEKNRFRPKGKIRIVYSEEDRNALEEMRANAKALGYVTRSCGWKSSIDLYKDGNEIGIAFSSEEKALEYALGTKKKWGKTFVGGYLVDESGYASRDGERYNGREAGAQ